MRKPPRMEKLVSDIEPSNAPRGPVNWVLNRADLLGMIEMMRNASEVVMDLETTGLDPHARTVRSTGGKFPGSWVHFPHIDQDIFVPASNGGVAARISMASLTLPQRNADGAWDGAEPATYIVPLSHPDSPFLGEWVKVMRLIARAMVKFNSRFVNHHAKFDAHWILACTGINITHLIHWDTQSSCHLIDETQSTKLKDAAPRRFGIPRWDDHDLSFPGASEEVEFWELGEYAARDTYWTWALYVAHRHQLFLDDPFEQPLDQEEFRDARLGRVARYVTAPTARSLGEIEQRGIRLDIDFAREHYGEQALIARERLDEISELYSMDRSKASGHATSGWFKELTQKAVDVGELVVASRTKGGNPQWDKHVLKKQARRGSEIARLILEQRDAAKQAEFLMSWLEKVSPDGYLHSSYRAGHVTTGRLSSAGPNMQQISKKLRPAFIPREGHVMAELDYSQLELRVIAFISRSQPMIDAYATGQDLHKLLAVDIVSRRQWKDDPTLARISVDDVTDDDRQAAKSANFGLAYMQQVEGFRSYADKTYGVEFTMEEAQDVYDTYFETWQGMKEWHERTVREASRNGYAVSPIGRVRNLPNLQSGSQWERLEAGRQAVNAPVQGFGSDLMQMAIASMLGIMPGSARVETAFPVATVHDSVVLEIAEDGWEETVKVCQERMTNLDQYLRRMDCELDIPLQADATVGLRWGDGSLMSS